MTGGSVGFVGFDYSVWGGTVGSSGFGFVGREGSADVGVLGSIDTVEDSACFGGLVCSGRLSEIVWELVGTDDSASDSSCFG